MWILIKRYIEIYIAFFKAGFITDIEYRANFIFRILGDILWYTGQLATFEVIYLQTPTLGGWNIEQLRIFLGVLFVVDSLYMILFAENLDHFSEKVKKGDLDLLLAKPVDTQFMLSCKKVGTLYCASFLIASSFLTWAIYSYSHSFSWIQIFWFLILLPCGLLIMYSFKFSFSILAIIFSNSQNLQYAWYQFYRLGMRPDSIYQPWLRYILLSVLPVALISSTPARILVYGVTQNLVIWSLMMTAITLIASRLLWKKSVKYYGSASS